MWGGQSGRLRWLLHVQHGCHFFGVHELLQVLRRRSLFRSGGVRLRAACLVVSVRAARTTPGCYTVFPVVPGVVTAQAQRWSARHFDQDGAAIYGSLVGKCFEGCRCRRGDVENSGGAGHVREPWVSPAFADNPLDPAEALELANQELVRHFREHPMDFHRDFAAVIYLFIYKKPYRPP